MRLEGVGRNPGPGLDLYSKSVVLPGMKKPFHEDSSFLGYIRKTRILGIPPSASFDKFVLAGPHSRVPIVLHFRLPHLQTPGAKVSANFHASCIDVIASKGVLRPYPCHTQR